MVRSPKIGRRVAVRLFLIAACLAPNAGCVVRRYTLRTDPPGATAIVNGEEIGPTPVSQSFTYYGDREITFLLDGYETKTVIQPMKAPWWDNLLTEFVAENMIPYTLRDEREFHYDLDPATSPRAGDLHQRAEAHRADAHAPPKPKRRGFFAWLGFD